jgi:hypothetical protein
MTDIGVSYGEVVGFLTSYPNEIAASITLARVSGDTLGRLFKA